MSTQAEITARFANIQTWQKADLRAPHKPLLLLLALAGVQSGQPRLMPYEQTAKQLKRLLIDFGPPRKTQHPEHPFWRLRNDQLWEIPQAPLLESSLNLSGDISPKLLKQTHAYGGFPLEIWEFLRARPALVNQLAAELLNSHFPVSYHEAILDAVGFPWVVEKKAARRNPNFRDLILRLYEHRCAICGFDGRLGYADLALEAAHIKWHSAGGPDTENNGLALCSFHHQIFDRGAISIDKDYRVIISQDVHGQNQVDDWILRFQGQALLNPISTQASPKMEFIKWHHQEVFRHPQR